VARKSRRSGRKARDTIMPESLMNFAIFTWHCSMKRKKGDLPGRYVPPHMRKWPKNPTEYVNVTAYQERIEPEPSELQLTPVQGELELIVTSSEQGDSDKQNSSSGGE
jgi:hypothetical protein